MSSKLLQQIFKKVYGKPSCHVHRGYGSSLTINFGKPRLEVHKKLLKPIFWLGTKHRRRDACVRGDWRLWIFGSVWEVREGKRKIGNSESAEKPDRVCPFL